MCGIYVDMLTPMDETLNNAFRLAHFINGNKETAIRILLGAVAKLEVSASAQCKRLYYKPSGRSVLYGTRPNRFRTKITFSEPHLLQRLIYIESEPYEKQKELAHTGPTVREEDMIIHFIKHLVRITLKRNSFYVTLGISRLLYNYTTTETMGIYNVVIQDPERVKDDYYYRSRKGVLMQEIKERFGDLIRICQGQRGETRFEAAPNSDKFVTLVRECLAFFTPWATPCSIPAGLDPVMNSVPLLLYRNEAVEDEVELNRIHAVLHPECYQRLTTALGLQTPDQRLELPQFRFSNQSRNEGESMRTPTLDLSKEELTTIKSDLDELAERRKKASAGFLHIFVDGTEYARLDLKRTGHARFPLEAWNELIEIWTNDEKGDLLLASHLLTFDKQVKTEATKSRIVLEGGQKLSIDILPSTDASGSIVNIRYRETNPLKATSFVFHRLLGAPANDRWLLAGRRLFGTRSSVLIPASAFIFLLTLTAGVLIYLQRDRKQLDSQAVASRKDTSHLPETSVPGPGHTSSPTQTTGAIHEQPEGKSSGSTGRQNPSLLSRDKQPQRNGEMAPQPTSVEPPSTASSGEEATRAITRAEMRLSLREVKSVFVEIVGDDPSNQILRAVLLKRIQASDTLILSKSRDEADAVLQVRTMEGEAGPTSIQSGTSVLGVQLINAHGQVIWPLKRRSFKRTYSGRMAEQVGSQILQDLLIDIEQQKRRR